MTRIVKPLLVLVGAMASPTIISLAATGTAWAVSVAVMLANAVIVGACELGRRMRIPALRTTLPVRRPGATLAAYAPPVVYLTDRHNDSPVAGL